MLIYVCIIEGRYKKKIEVLLVKKYAPFWRLKTPQKRLSSLASTICLCNSNMLSTVRDDRQKD